MEKEDNTIEDLFKKDLFEILDEYKSMLENCKDMEIGSQRAAKEKRYRLLKRNVQKAIQEKLLEEAEAERARKKEEEVNFQEDEEKKLSDAVALEKPSEEESTDTETSKTIKRLKNTTLSLKTDISEARKALVKDFFEKPDDSLTEEQETEREVRLQARVNTVKQLMATYKSSQ